MWIQEVKNNLKYIILGAIIIIISFYYFFSCGQECQLKKIEAYNACTRKAENNDLYLNGKFKSTTEKVYNEYIKTCMKTKGF